MAVCPFGDDEMMKESAATVQHANMPKPKMGLVSGSKPEAPPAPKAKATKAEPPKAPTVFPYRVKCKCRWRFTVNRPGRYGCPECANVITIE